MTTVPGDRVRFHGERHQRALAEGTGTVLGREDRDGVAGVHVRFDYFSDTDQAPYVGWWAEDDLVVVLRVSNRGQTDLVTTDEPAAVTPEFAIFGVRTVDGVRLVASTELTDATLADRGSGGARFAGAADRVLVVTGKTYAFAVRALLDHFDFPDLMNSPFQPGATSE